MNRLVTTKNKYTVEFYSQIWLYLNGNFRLEYLKLAFRGRCHRRVHDKGIQPSHDNAAHFPKVIPKLPSKARIHILKWTCIVLCQGKQTYNCEDLIIRKENQ